MSWIDVNHQVPAEGEEVLITGYIQNRPGNDRWYAVAYREHGEWLESMEDMPLFPATHWMPIPAVSENDG